ncbi:MAG: response regulator [Lachnospiraceae bacterium]|nr:response regulator [Lachnospiraceae bacterium]
MGDKLLNRKKDENIPSIEQLIPAIEWVAEQMPGGFFIYRADNTQEILYANQAVYRIFGCDTQEEFCKLTGNTFHGMIHPDDHAEIQSLIAEQIVGSTSQKLDYVKYRIIQKSGEIRWVDDYGHFTHMPKYGDVFYVFIGDITEKQLAQENYDRLLAQKQEALDELQHETSSLKTVHEMLGSGKWTMEFDEKGEMIHVNWSNEFRRMLGYEGLEDFPDVLESWSDLLHPNDKERVLKEYRDTINDYTGQKIYDVEYQLLTRNQGYRWYRATGKPTRRADGTPITYVGLFVDITEKKQMDEELTTQQLLLEKALKEAQAANKAKTRFLSNMSHDIRTPMNAIIGFTDLALLDTGNRKLIQEYLTKIKASSEHLLSLINDVLEMSRIESGKIELNEAPVNLPDILRDLNTIIIGQVEGKHQELFMDAVNVSNEDIICDKLRLNQILLNLVSNAVKYTPTGGKISVRIIQKETAKDGKAPYEIRVKDTGIGMAPEFAERVFVAFEREKTSTVSGIQGTGLGMAITKRIVELMNGTISVETMPNKGTEFIVCVEFKVQQGEKKNYRIPQLAGVHALVVDDDYDTCDSTTRLLSDMEMRSEWTLSGKEAVLRAKQAKERGDSFGVYIIDWRLPDLSGLEVARRIRQEIGENTPILLITAYDWLAIKEEAERSGINGFCNKPLFASELHASLVRVIGTADAIAAEKEAESELPADFSGKRLLLVEDMPINRQIAIAILDMYGFEVEEAENGAEGVEKFRNAPPGYYDAILMDIQMPEMNGYEASKAIRALPESRGAHIPIFAMTANAFDEDKQLALDAGMSGHIAKPIDREKLIDALSKFLCQS